MDLKIPLYSGAVAAVATVVTGNNTGEIYVPLIGGVQPALGQFAHVALSSIVGESVAPMLPEVGGATLAGLEKQIYAPAITGAVNSQLIRFLNPQLQGRTMMKDFVIGAGSNAVGQYIETMMK
jgi:hypothetical protein